MMFSMYQDTALELLRSKVPLLPIQLSLSDVLELKDRLPVQCPAITELNWYQTTVQSILRKEKAV